MPQKKQESITATLLISCTDQKGIVAAVSGFILGNGGNIIHADQHTDFEEHIFFQRVEWELDGLGLKKENVAREFERVAEKFKMNWKLCFSDEVKKIALFASREEHCVSDLLMRQRIGEIRAEIPVILSNHESMKAIADMFGIRFEFLESSQNAKQESEQKALRILNEEKIDCIVLAKYMQVLSSDFVRHFSQRIINIHHSFLPAFVGARPYHQAYKRGVKIIGATAHFVTAELDGGPIIAQNVARVSHKDSVPEMIEKGRDLEKMVLARAVKAYLNNKVFIYKNKTVVFD